MRLAIFSDIHGNSLALDAVLDDCQRRGDVDRFLVLGDLAAIGPDPVGVLERLQAVTNATIVRGNTEDYLVGRDSPYPEEAEVAARPELAPLALEVARSMAWTQGAVTAAGWLEWLDRLPQEARLALPGGRTLLGNHAEPGAGQPIIGRLRRRSGRGRPYTPAPTHERGRD